MNCLGESIFMRLYEKRESRCESPLIMISASASTAHSRILLSAGSSFIKLIDFAGLTIAQSECSSSITSRAVPLSNPNFGLFRTSRISSIIGKLRKKSCRPEMSMSSIDLGIPPKRIPEIITFVSRTIRSLFIAAASFQFSTGLFHAQCLPLRVSLRTQQIRHKRKSPPISVSGQYRLLPLRGGTPSVSCVPALRQCQSPTGDFSGTKYSQLKYSSVSDSFFIKIYNLCMMSRKKLVLS